MPYAILPPLKPELSLDHTPAIALTHKPLVYLYPMVTCTLLRDENRLAHNWDRVDNVVASNDSQGCFPCYAIDLFVCRPGVAVILVTPPMYFKVKSC